MGDIFKVASAFLITAVIFLLFIAILSGAVFICYYIGLEHGAEFGWGAFILLALLWQISVLLIQVEKAIKTSNDQSRLNRDMILESISNIKLTGRTE